jgi:hypothetical protein
MPVPALVDADLATRQFSVRARDVVYVKGVLEASEGLGVLFGERGGELILATPKSRLAELDRMLADLQKEIGGVLEGQAVGHASVGQTIGRESAEGAEQVAGREVVRS